MNHPDSVPTNEKIQRDWPTKITEPGSLSRISDPITIKYNWYTALNAGNKNANDPGQRFDLTFLVVLNSSFTFRK